MSSNPSKGSDEKGNADMAKMAAVAGVVVAGGLAIYYLNSRKGMDQDEDYGDDFKYKGRRDRGARKADEIGGRARNAAEETKGFFQRTKDDLSQSAKETGNRVKSKTREVGDSAKRNLRTHHVQKGDTLYSLSRKYRVPVQSIKRQNGIFGDDIHPGDELYMPDN